MRSIVNDKTVCFIICSNNPLYTEECIYYIENLKVPEDYQIEVLTIHDAKSMTSGYNEGMYASDAKYKVYLHQDTFIVNHNFIQDILDIFTKDASIGMIGMVGAPRLPYNGVMWEEKRCGGLYHWNVVSTEESWMEEKFLGETEVEVVDGFLMATQYDIPWREDLFDKWDFYDCSQCKEFARHGYKVIVPKMEKPWCIHDSGYLSLDNYDGERNKFIQEYCMEIPDWVKWASYQTTVVVTSYNQKAALQNTLKRLEDEAGICNIIVVDNGSSDGTAEWLATQPYEYIWFDEGTQGFGKVWNTVLQNFKIAEYIVFLEAGVYPAKGSLVKMMKAICAEHVGIVSSMSNFFPAENDIVKNEEGLDAMQIYFAELPENLWYKKLLSANWKLWMAHKSIFDKHGFFQEELQLPQNVLLDYSLRMIVNGDSQIVCNQALSYETFRYAGEVYAQADKWKSEDKEVLKHVWKGMNYFNLVPNGFLVESIQEDPEKEFDVLEVGCDLGATLFEMKQRYPRCNTYGLDINEAALEIAKHITNAKYGNIDAFEIPFDEKFDYIIFGDVLEHLRHPKEVLEMCHSHLKENGYIIASIPNIMHISVIEQLIHGMFSYQDTGLLDRTHIHFFTYYEILLMFQDAGYKVEETVRNDIPMSEEQRKIANVLLSLSEDAQDWMYETMQYVVKARRIESVQK